MRKFILCFVTLASVLCAEAQQVAPFKRGERAVFLGNSITDGGHYHSYIWLYYMTRFPYMDLKVFNAGIGGDTVLDMYERLEGDVLEKKPTVLMVTFGMNDTGYYEYNGSGAEQFGREKYDACYENYKKLEAKLKELSNVRVVMVGGSPFDEGAKIESTSFKGKNDVMDKVVAFQRKSAEENGWEFVDFSAPMTAINRREQAKEPAFTLCGSDRIHPGNDGHMVMTYLFLKAQGFAGKAVAEMEIDAEKRKALKAENCKISKIKHEGDCLSFNYHADALPYPMDTVTRGWGAVGKQASAARVVPFVEEMNREMLCVKGLSGTYSVHIDDVEIGSWSAEQLAAGVNMATIDRTPQYQQALQVMYLNEARWEVERRFRDEAWMRWGLLQRYGLERADNRQAVDKIDEHKERDGWVNAHRDNYAQQMHEGVREGRQQQMQVLIDQIYKLNKPQVRKIELRKVK